MCIFFHRDRRSLRGSKGQICQNSPIPIRRSNFKRQILKLLVPTCWPWTNMQEFPRWPFRPTNGWGVKGQKRSNFFKQLMVNMAKKPKGWCQHVGLAWANMQKCPRWPFCPTYGSGVKGQICQNSPIPIRRSNYKQRQIVKLLVPTCWPWTNMQKFPWWPFRPN